MSASNNNEALIAWYHLVDARSCKRDHDGAYAVVLPPNALNYQLCSAIVAQEKQKLAKVSASSLQVFATPKVLETKTPLKKSHPLSDIAISSPNSEDEPWMVLAPHILSYEEQFPPPPPLTDAERSRLKNAIDIVARIRNGTF